MNYSLNQNGHMDIVFLKKCKGITKKGKLCSSIISGDFCCKIHQTKYENKETIKNIEKQMANDRFFIVCVLTKLVAEQNIRKQIYQYLFGQKTGCNHWKPCSVALYRKIPQCCVCDKRNEKIHCKYCWNQWNPR